MQLINFVKISLTFLFLCALPTNAGLIDRGNGFIYDEDLNITWLQDANLGAGSSYDDGGSAFDGRMTWQSATAWADSLNLNGYTNWRLPTAEPNCSYLRDCNFGEIGHLFFDEIGATRGSSIKSVINTTNLDFFINIQDYVYWTSLPDNRYLPSDPGAIGFDMTRGVQSDFWQRNDFFAWAVHDGDIGALAVPEPRSIFVLIMGIFALGVRSFKVNKFFKFTPLFRVEAYVKKRF